MCRRMIITLATGLSVVAAAGCATKGYVATTIDQRTQEVERRVGQVERTLEDTAAGTGRNAARILEVDRTASDAHESASEALATSRQAELTAADTRTRVDGLETASRRLLFEVKVVADHRRFGFADATLPKAVSDELDEMMSRIRSLATSADLEIEGHADATGPAPYNARLGLRRAESVRRYLHEEHGLPLHKISVISYGEEKPVAPNDTNEGRAMNRRVVVRVLG